MKTLKELREARGKTYELYHNSYTSAIQTAIGDAEKQGFTLDDDERYQEIGAGPGKPKNGKTVRHTLKLYKNGKVQRKALHLQVYNRGSSARTKPYELNYYIS